MNLIPGDGCGEASTRRCRQAKAKSAAPENRGGGGAVRLRNKRTTQDTERHGGDADEIVSQHVKENESNRKYLPMEGTVTSKALTITMKEKSKAVAGEEGEKAGKWCRGSRDRKVSIVCSVNAGI